MSKKSNKKNTAKSRQKKNVNKPEPSIQKNKTQNKHSSENKKQNVSSKNKRKRQKNQLPINGNTDYGDPFNTPDSVDAGAEKILKKPRRESALHYSTPLPPAKEPDSPSKRRLLRILFYVITILVVLGIFLILSFTVFFKIEEISVSGETRYNEANIIASSMINPGDNFFLCNTSPGENEIWKKFPYIESVHIEKKLFNKIVINVKEAVPTSVIESEGKYVLLSESGKIIDISDKRQNDVPIVMGAKLDDPALSSSAVYKDKSVENYVQEILQAAEDYKFGELKVIDITKLSNISLETKDGLHIILGSPEDIDHKMMTASKIMKKDVPAGDVGTLDVSLSASEGGKSYFSSQKPPEQSSHESSKQEASKQETSKQESSRRTETSSQSSTESSGQSSQQSGESSAQESSQDNTYEPSDDGGYDDGGYDDGGYDDGGYDDGGYDDGGYDDGGYDDGGYDDGGYDDGGNDDGGYDDGGNDDGGYDDGGNDDGGYDDGGNDDGGYDDGGYDDGGNDDGGNDDGGYDDGGYDDGGYDNSGYDQNE